MEVVLKLKFPNNSNIKCLIKFKIYVNDISMASYKVHYDYHEFGTKEWLVEFGLTEDEASAVAASNNNLDAWFGGMNANPPWLPAIGGRPDLHFNRNRKGKYGSKEDTRVSNAMKYLKDSISFKASDRLKSLQFLSIALHCFQDLAFHTDDCVFNPLGLLSFHNLRADCIYMRPVGCSALCEFYTKALADMWCKGEFDPDAPFWEIDKIKVKIEV